MLDADHWGIQPVKTGNRVAVPNSCLLKIFKYCGHLFTRSGRLYHFTVYLCAHIFKMCDAFSWLIIVFIPPISPQQSVF